MPGSVLQLYFLQSYCIEHLCVMWLQSLHQKMLRVQVAIWLPGQVTALSVLISFFPFLVMVLAEEQLRSACGAYWYKCLLPTS